MRSDFIKGAEHANLASSIARCDCDFWRVRGLCRRNPNRARQVSCAISGLRHCHTPGALLGKPDATRTLAGSEVGFGIPGVGVFVGGNLTPDKETGLGDLTTEQIIAAITKGVMPNGRKLFPVMPWPDLAHLSSDDAQAIAAYLKSLPPVKTRSRDVRAQGRSIDAGLVIVPGDVYAKMPPPK